MPAEPYTAEALTLRPHPYAAAPAAHVPGRIGPEELGPGDVLVLRALGLGDALTGVAALRGLRRLFPDRRIVLAAPATIGGWFVELGIVDATLPTPGLVPLPGLAGGHVAVDLHGRGPASQRLLTGTRPDRLIAFDCPDVGHRGPRWEPEEHEVHRWCRLVNDAGGSCSAADLRLRHRDNRPRRAGGPVIVHPGAASSSRRWPVARWQELVTGVRALGRQVLVTGSADEVDLAAALAARQDPDAVNLAGRLDLAGLLQVVTEAAVVISGDTGTAHLATAVATPSVVLFGPVPPHRWGPAIDPDLHRVLWHGDPDAAHWGDPHGDDLDPRLEQITVAEVLAAVTEMLHAGRRVDPTAPDHRGPEPDLLAPTIPGSRS